MTDWLNYNLNPEAWKLLDEASADAAAMGHNEVRPFHLASKLCRSADSFIEEVFRRSNVSLDGVREKIASSLASMDPTASKPGEISASKELKAIVRDAIAFSKTRGDVRVGIPDLFASLISDYRMQIVLPHLGIDSRKLLFRTMDVVGQAHLPTTPREMVCKEIQDQIRLVTQVLGEINRNVERINLYPGD